MSNSYCVRAVVSGRVQGVYFRAYTQRQAQSLALIGYAKNLNDGTVEVLACGEPENVTALLAWLEQGSPHSEVAQVVTQELECPKNLAQEFSTY